MSESRRCSGAEAPSPWWCFPQGKELLKPQQTRRQELQPARGARASEIWGASGTATSFGEHRVPEEGLSLCSSPSVSQKLLRSQASVAGSQAAVGHGWVTWVC